MQREELAAAASFCSLEFTNMLLVPAAYGCYGSSVVFEPRIRQKSADDMC